MSAKYSKLSMEDQEEGLAMNSAVIDFGSIHQYKVTDYSNLDKSEYRSIYSYTKPKSTESKDDFIPPSTAVNLCTGFITAICYILVVIGFPITWWFCFKNVQLYERLVIFRLGRLLSVKESGIAIVLPCLDKVTLVNMRMRAFSVPPQKIITGDGAVLEIGADVYFRVKDPAKSVAAVQDLNFSLRTSAVASLQNVFSRQKLKLIEVDKAYSISWMQAEINQMSLTWGIEIGKVELSQITVLEKDNPIVEAASGGGVDAVQLISQIFGSSSSPVSVPTLAMPMPNTQEQSAPKDSTPAISSAYILPQHLIAIAKPMLSYELVKEYGAIFQFVLTGNGGGCFYLDLKNEGGHIGEGMIGEQPDVTITLTLDDMNLLLAGKMSAFDAYMGSRLQVEGDLRTAMNMQDVVTRIQQQLFIAGENSHI